MAIPKKTPLITLMSVEAQHAAQIRKTLTMSANRIEKELKAHIKKGGNAIIRMQLEAQRASIYAMLNQDFSDIETAVREGKKAAAKAASAVVSQYENQLLKTVMSKEAMQALAISEANRAASGLDAALQRISGTSKIPLSSQVYKTQQMTLGWVDARINQALVSGWSWQKLSAEIRGMIDPNVPGGVSYAANRLARTEINNAFHASSVDRFQKSNLVESVDWHLSTSHPEGDECDNLAADSPYPPKSVPSKPHPHCYCYITPGLPTEAQFIQNLFDGKYDDDNFMEYLDNDTEVTWNQIAKRFKIKSPLLESSGATPVQMRDFLTAIGPKNVTKIKKLDPELRDIQLGKAKDFTPDPKIPKGKTPLKDVPKKDIPKTPKSTSKVPDAKTPTKTPPTATAKPPSIPSPATPGKLLTPEERWLGKAMPTKPVPPVAPQPLGRAAFSEWEKKVAARFKEFAKSTGNSKSDITKSLNWPQFLRVMEKNDISALDALRAGKYIDQDLYDEALAAMKAAKKPVGNAADYKRALAQHARDKEQYEVDLGQWREVNGITSQGKGLDGALRHRTNSEGTDWANANLKVADGVGQDAAKRYTGSDYSEWNSALRKSDKDGLPEPPWAAATKKLDDAMDDVPEDIIVHRGTNWNEFLTSGGRVYQMPPPPPSELIGTVQTNRGYMSTSVGNSSAFSSQPIQMVIRVPKGHGAAWVDPYSRHRGERELLLERNTSLYIHDVYQKDGRWIIEAEVVPAGQDATVWIPMPSGKR